MVSTTEKKGVFVQLHQEAHFGEWFAERIEALVAHIKAIDENFSLNKMAAELGDTPQHLWEYRHGRRYVTSPVALRFAAIAARYEGGMAVLLGEEGVPWEESGKGLRPGSPSLSPSAQLASEWAAGGSRPSRRPTTTRF